MFCSVGGTDCIFKYSLDAFSRCLVVTVLAIGPEVRGFIPGRVCWVSKGVKNPQHAFFEGK
jgi:hypothetical protein